MNPFYFTDVNTCKPDFLIQLVIYYQLLFLIQLLNSSSHNVLPKFCDKTNTICSQMIFYVSVCSMRTTGSYKLRQKPVFNMLVTNFTACPNLSKPHLIKIRLRCYLAQWKSVR